MSRIKIRVSAGVFEVSLLRVIEENKSVEVLWDRGIKREFKWGSVVFGQTDGQTVMQKPSEPAPEREPLFLLLSTSDPSLLEQRCLSGVMQRLRFTLQLFHLLLRLPLAPLLRCLHRHLDRCIPLLIIISLPRRCMRLAPGPIKRAKRHPSIRTR